jgi:hypothetical protein
MNNDLRKKIEAKRSKVGLSFYAFFANKNDNPAVLMQAATWWIEKHQLDHFEKAAKIKKIVISEGVIDQPQPVTP